MGTLQYATTFNNVLRELYGQLLTSVDLFNSNQDLKIINGKDIKIPVLSVSGYKDHTRGAGFNSGTYLNDYETKSLDHDRDIEFAIDPMDVDETNLVVSVGNIQNRFERTQAIPELDCYTYSKLYAEAKRVGAVIDNTVLTTANILDKIDSDIEAFADAGVPLERLIMYATSGVQKLIKNADKIEHTLDASKGAALDRRVYGVDDIGKIVSVPKSRFQTKFDFTDGYKTTAAGKQINYIIVDPEAQVSRVKYSYINVFTPGTDSRTADRYMYQNRRYNGTFGIDQLLKQGVRINAEAEA
jgi:hypothetical protein